MKKSATQNLSSRDVAPRPVAKGVHATRSSKRSFPRLSPAGVVCAMSMLAVAAFLIGCPNSPCVDDNDEACKTESTGLVCNMALTFLLPNIGTCQYPGELDDPCADSRDCAQGYTCQFDLEECKVSFGQACAKNEDCYDYHPKAGPNTCVNGTCRGICRYWDPCDDNNDCWGGLTCHPYSMRCI